MLISTVLLLSIHLPPRRRPSDHNQKAHFHFCGTPWLHRESNKITFLPKNKGVWALTHLNVKAQSMCATSTLKAAFAISTHPGPQLTRYNFDRPTRRFFPENQFWTQHTQNPGPLRSAGAHPVQSKRSTGKPQYIKHHHVQITTERESDPN